MLRNIAQFLLEEPEYSKGLCFAFLNFRSCNAQCLNISFVTREEIQGL